MVEQVIAYANRLPVSGGRGGLKPSSGGLVAALRPALEQHHGSWVGWDGGASDIPRRVEGLDIDLYPVQLSRRTVDGHYHGFSNRTLWPLLHGFVEQPSFDRDWWRAYRTVNEHFAEVDVDAPADSLHWVHDYHLMLLPELLRRQLPDARIGFFLHVPFPATELYARLPWREQLLEGLLGADVVAFHTAEYRDNFLSACARLFGEARVEGHTVELHGRRIRAEAHPISVDARELAELSASQPVARYLAQLRRQFAGRTVLLGVDRLDYTKGILERLRAIELLLRSAPRAARPAGLRPGRRAEPRRGARVPRAARGGRADRRQDQRPLHRARQGRADLLPATAACRASACSPTTGSAEVCLVTPLRDGMNLVAKEFVTAQAAGGEDGVLVLSEFTGATHELREALPCNPYDVDGVSATVELALALQPDDRRRRIETMAKRIARHDVHWWADAELDAIGRSRPQAAEPAQRPEAARRRASRSAPRSSPGGGEPRPRFIAPAATAASSCGRAIERTSARRAPGRASRAAGACSATTRERRSPARRCARPASGVSGDLCSMAWDQLPPRR